jgi:hypothetical protein
VASGTKLICTRSGLPAESGTLTKASGTGDATLTFSAYTTGGITNRTSADLATAAQAGDIQSGTTISGVAGTLTLPAEADVETGVTYGAGGTEFTGTLAGGAGGGPLVGSSALISA